MVRRAINTRFGGVKLHHILRSDDDRDLHDHPWSFLSIVLKGGYWEHTPTDCPSRPLDGGPHLAYENEGDTQNGLIYCRFCGLVRTRWTRKRWHGPGSILWRPAPSIHRLELPEPTRSPFNVPEDNTAWTSRVHRPEAARVGLPHDLRLHPVVQVQRGEGGGLLTWRWGSRSAQAR
jgi:hypothetical protein